VNPLISRLQVKSRDDANALAWRYGFEGLRRAVANADSVAFETTETACGLPAVQRVFRIRERRIVEPDVEVLMKQAPEWAKPLVAAAVRCDLEHGRPRRKK
jgi:hypothetical protein